MPTLGVTYKSNDNPNKIDVMKELTDLTSAYEYSHWTPSTLASIINDIDNIVNWAEANKVGIEYLTVSARVRGNNINIYTKSGNLRLVHEWEGDY